MDTSRPGTNPRGEITATAAAPVLMRNVAVQIAETLHQGGARSVDVTLQPEELGRVRITMSTEQGALSVTLQVDRPETLDLMRRHIDQFAGELRRLGHGSVGFSFQDGSSNGGGPRPDPGTGMPVDEGSALSGDDLADRVRTPTPVPLAPHAGVDIRL